MAQHLYLSFLPEALIFSMLSPEEFGKYLAIGAKKQSRAHAMFFSVDPSVEVPGVDIAAARERCVAHADGSPRHSVYASVYRALERVPMGALGQLHLVTKDGLVLTLEQGEYRAGDSGRHFLYQEICPVSPRVVSTLEPKAFSRYVTHPENPLYLPKLVFADMELGGLARDPEHAETKDLPYPEMDHLRSCLRGLEVGGDGGKKTKIVRRELHPDLIFFLIENGFYVGDQEAFLFYPMPDEDSLLETHNRWWNSATKVDRY